MEISQSNLFSFEEPQQQQKKIVEPQNEIAQPWLKKFG